MGIWGQTFSKNRRLGETGTRRNGCFADEKVVLRFRKIYTLIPIGKPAPPMKKLYFDELSTDFLTRSELYIDFILEKV